MSEIADISTSKRSTDTEATLEAAAKRLPRRKFFSDMPDKGLFAFVATVGFAVIVVLKAQSWANPEQIAAFAIALMLLYGVVAFQMPLVQMRLDRLGDNFYYLGFIYTLASLTIALWQLRGGTRVDELLGSFGIALVTTIFGIAGRVLFAQLRSDLDDIEERVRRDIAATSSELRAQLGSSIAEFETFRTALMQTLQETAAQCEQTCKTQITQIDGLARSSAERIGEAFRENGRHAQDLNSAIAAVSKGVQQITENIATTKLPSQELEQEVAAFAHALKTILGELARVVDARRTRRRRWYWPFRSN